MQNFDLPESKIQSLVADAVGRADDGELFIEQAESELLVFDNGRLKTSDFRTRTGFGLRVVAGEACGFASSDQITKSALLSAVDSVSCVRNGYSATLQAASKAESRDLYVKENPLLSPLFEKKAHLLEEIDSWIRTKNPAVRQVTVSFSSSCQTINIVRPDGLIIKDMRPLVRMSITVIAGQGNRQETGVSGKGGRMSSDIFFSPQTWQSVAQEALQQAFVNLESVPSPAGTFDIILANGFPGVMLHEAVGHGLEGDFNRKKTSAFANLLGARVAPKGVTVIDDGTLPRQRGSLNTDDEGTPSARNVLIEDGILVQYMHDRQNARLTGMKPTGNGRRESFACQPMPRMTNTFMANGDSTPEEIIASVDNGIYAVAFGGGQVDITSGKFVFECTEAYRIEKGKIAAPLKGAMLVGEGPQAMHRIAMVGNDMKLDPGVGTCGKAGQNVPVCVGQPHLRMNGITIAGTSTV